MILVATRSISLREGLLALLTAITPDQPIVFVGETAEVTQQLGVSDIDLVVLDAALLAASPEPVLTQIKQASPVTRLMVLADSVQQQNATAQLGVEAVMLKGTAASEIATTIEHLLDA